MSWTQIGCNSPEIIFMLLIFWGIIIRLNRIEHSIDELKKK